MANLFTVQQLPATSQEAIREFDERYLAGVLAAPPPSWCSDLGEVTDLASPSTTFPIGLLTTKYGETREQAGRFLSMQEKDFDLKVVEYDTGYEAKLLDILTNSFAYRKWQQAPEEFLKAEVRHINRQIAALLQAGTSGTTPWDDLAFFSASHLADPSGPAVAANQWSNYQSSATDITVLANLTTEITSMRGVKDQNGDKLGVEPDTILCPTSAFQAIANLFKQDFVVIGSLDGAGGGTMGTVRNPYVGAMNVVHAPELDDTGNTGPIYMLDTKLTKGLLSPWIAGKYRVPDTLGLRFWDEGSDYFKDSGKIKVSSHVWQGFGLVFPHAIRRINRA